MANRLNPSYVMYSGDDFRKKTTIDFMNKIKYICFTKSLNMGDVAKMVGVSKGCLAQFNSGSKYMNLKMMGKLSDALNLSISVDIKPRVRAVKEEATNETN